MENNDIEDLQDLNKEDYIKNMRKNRSFGGRKLKIICFVRNLQEINEYKDEDSDSIYCFISGKENITEIYIMININN